MIMLEQHKVNYFNRYKVKGTVKTEHLGGRPKKSTPRTDRKMISYVKNNPFAST